jgi:exosortase C (VPDSG-CTERM-specific)
MNLETGQSNSDVAPVAGTSPRTTSPARQFVPSWRRFKGLAIFAGVLVLLFARPLIALLRFAPHEELYSHILLIPFISAYLIWMKRGQVVSESQPNRALALLPFAIGAVVLIAYAIGLKNGRTFADVDYLAIMTLAFLCFLLGGSFIFVGRSYLRSIMFPVTFLFLCVPFPKFVRHGIEVFFQNGSAATAGVMLDLSGMPVLKTGTYFQMPGFSLNVQPECSGIHSSLILFITSLLAAYLFLQTPWRRWLFVLAVIPLALLRNGFRIFSLGQIGVHFDPLILDSWFHHHGGPLFFGLSLVPLFLLLRYLIKSETRKQQVMAHRSP